MTVLACLCTCPDAEGARHLAEALVSERLAACVNLVPGLRSVYRWDGEVRTDDEVLLVIKTDAARLEALQARVQALHPYDEPELLAFEATGGLPGYLAWVAAETAVAGTD